MYSVCSVHCISNSGDDYYGQFDNIQLSSKSDDALNYVLQSSIIYSENEKEDSIYTMCHWYGNIFIKAVNCSNNACFRISGICCYLSDSTSTASSVSSIIEYSSFVNNVASDRKCLLFDYKNHQLKNSNIINNSQPTTTNDGIVNFYGLELLINESAFLNNEAKYLFYADTGSLVYCDEHCYIDISTKYGSVDIPPSSANKFTNNFDYVHVLYLCYFIKSNEVSSLKVCPKRTCHDCEALKFIHIELFLVFVELE